MGNFCVSRVSGGGGAGGKQASSGWHVSCCSLCAPTTLLLLEAVRFSICCLRPLLNYCSQWGHEAVSVALKLAKEVIVTRGSFFVREEVIDGALAQLPCMWLPSAILALSDFV